MTTAGSTSASVVAIAVVEPVEGDRKDAADDADARDLAAVQPRRDLAGRVAPAPAIGLEAGDQRRPRHARRFACAWARSASSQTL